MSILEFEKFEAENLKQTPKNPKNRSKNPKNSSKSPKKPKKYFWHKFTNVRLVIQV